MEDKEYFSSKDFESTKELLNKTVELKALGEERTNMISSTLKDEDGIDIIQNHLDDFETPEELEKFLEGDINNKEVADRINEIFTDKETGEVAELTESMFKNKKDELQFKRDLAIYFKKNDYYMEKIDENIESLNKTTDNLSNDISEALNPLKDSIYGYGEYLIDMSKIDEDDTDEVKRVKKINMKKGIAIKGGYTFETLIDLIEKHPGIINNALKDFRNEDSIKKIGKRYADKLKNSKTSLNLFSLLNDDTHKSLEYLCIPKDDYPEGLENFTVFFIIRYMSMGLNDNEDVNLHASFYISLSKLREGSLDPDIKNKVINGMTKFLSYFNK